MHKIKIFRQNWIGKKIFIMIGNFATQRKLEMLKVVVNKVKTRTINTNEDDNAKN